MKLWKRCRHTRDRTSRTKFWIPTEQGREHEGHSDVYAAEGMARRAHGQRGSVDGNVPTKNGGETSKSGNETRTNTKSTEPSKILSLNAQGLIKTDTKWKVDMIKEYVHKTIYSS